jgi:hypothetical protein
VTDDDRRLYCGIYRDAAEITRSVLKSQSAKARKLMRRNSGKTSAR